MDDFKNLVHELVGAAQHELAQAFADQPDFKLEPVITFQDNGSVSTGFVPKPDYLETLYKATDSLAQLSEVASLLEHVKAHPAIAADWLVDAEGNELPSERLQEHFYSRSLTSFLAGYIKQITTIGGQVDETAFEASFTDLESYFRNDQVAVVGEAPLLGFYSDADDIEISENIRFRKRTEKDIARVSTPDPKKSDPDFLNTAFNSHFLVIESKLDKHGPTSTEHADAMAHNILSSLRLHQKGAVDLGTMHNFPKVRGVQHIGTMMSTVNNRVLTGRTYVLKPEDVASVVELYEKCSVGQTPEWQLALRRYNLTHERQQLEDRLLDSWVGLEALLLPDDRAELKFRASFRAAQFLGDDGAERLQIKEITQTSYRRRSEVIHGKPAKADLPHVTDETVDLLRRVLVRWLDPDFSHDVDAIDNALLE